MYASDDAPEPVVTLSDDNRPLGFYGVRDWQVLKVRFFVPSHRPVQRPTRFEITDLNPAASFTGQLSDTSQVEKFELSENEYAQRQGE